MGKFWNSDLVRQFPGRWTLYWLLVPNLGVILMWPIGGPPMRVALAIYGPLAVLASQLPWRSARTAGIAALTLWIVAFYICSMFAIPRLNYELLLQFLTDVRPMHSPEYVAGGVVLLAALALAVFRAPAVPRFSTPVHYLMAFLAVFAFINVDSVVTARTSTGYRMLPDEKVPVDAAVKQVGLAPDPARPRHVVVIIVEALGVPVGPEERRLFAATWDRPAWRDRYQVRLGQNLYFGPTTAGELRELCGDWAYHEGFDFTKADCLPERFRAAGYRTLAIHGFDGGMFGRTDWYPKLGFDEMEFADGLFRRGLDYCYGVFPGACDSEVPAIIGRRLAEARSPQFIYWLTLNSHLPVVIEDPRGCTIGDAAWRRQYPAICRLFQSHKEVADSIDRMIMAPGLPPTDILIVGDHKPPFFDRASRARFDQAHVPWIYLSAK